MLALPSALLQLWITGSSALSKPCLHEPLIWLRAWWLAPNTGDKEKTRTVTQGVGIAARMGLTRYKPAGSRDRTRIGRATSLANGLANGSPGRPWTGLDDAAGRQQVRGTILDACGHGRSCYGSDVPA